MQINVCIYDPAQTTYFHRRKQEKALSLICTELQGWSAVVPRNWSSVKFRAIITRGKEDENNIEPCHL